MQALRIWRLEYDPVELNKAVVVVSTGMSTVHHKASQAVLGASWAHMAYPLVYIFFSFSLFERGSPNLRMICHFGSNFLLQLGQKAVENLSFHAF